MILTSVMRLSESFLRIQKPSLLLPVSGGTSESGVGEGFGGEIGS